MEDFRKNIFNKKNKNFLLIYPTMVSEAPITLAMLGAILKRENFNVYTLVNTFKKPLKVESFVLIIPNKWDFIIRADRNSSRQYSFLESMDPVNMIKDNTSIPLFVFEYFAQKEMIDLIDETLEKVCVSF